MDICVSTSIIENIKKEVCEFKEIVNKIIGNMKSGLGSILSTLDNASYSLENMIKNVSVEISDFGLLMKEHNKCLEASIFDLEHCVCPHPEKRVLKTNPDGTQEFTEVIVDNDFAKREHSKMRIAQLENLSVRIKAACEIYYQMKSDLVDMQVHISEIRGIAKMKESVCNDIYSLPSKFESSLKSKEEKADKLFSNIRYAKYKLPGYYEYKINMSGFESTVAAAHMRNQNRVVMSSNGDSGQYCLPKKNKEYKTFDILTYTNKVAIYPQFEFCECETFVKELKMLEKGNIEIDMFIMFKEFAQKFGSSKKLINFLKSCGYEFVFDSSNCYVRDYKQRVLLRRVYEL